MFLGLTLSSWLKMKIWPSSFSVQPYLFIQTFTCVSEQTETVSLRLQGFTLRTSSRSISYNCTDETITSKVQKLCLNVFIQVHVMVVRNEVTLRVNCQSPRECYCKSRRQTPRRTSSYAFSHTNLLRRLSSFSASVNKTQWYRNPRL